VGPSACGTFTWTLPKKENTETLLERGNGWPVFCRAIWNEPAVGRLLDLCDSEGTQRRERYPANKAEHTSEALSRAITETIANGHNWLGVVRAIQKFER
jgi:hypothetical protein